MLSAANKNADCAMSVDYFPLLLFHLTLCRGLPAYRHGSAMNVLGMISFNRVVQPISLAKLGAIQSGGKTFPDGTLPEALPLAVPSHA
jgi:hypothetical protein